ncbi:PREDICTED: B-cell differentiation antigen CD72-like [Cariama cristata]|uniref:B-cell differentiation antigen CD72-like n=1 Tax=Cariama cristata TaxID=54380 RepID=UPI0005201B79|nr:PREDICTED: B-cell differentiation antigen CD72-like [Cariama cristata]
MAQSVVYADLKFAAVPPLTAPACPTAPHEDDSPYENVPLGSVPAAPSPGHWPRPRRIPMGLLAASLLLLLVATVALGACYWQVTRSLQDTSRQHAAEQGRLSQEVSAQEQSLEQAQLELAWARAELQRTWREGNSSQLEMGSLNAELRSRDAELGHARQQLAVLEKQIQEVRGELRASESAVSSLRACVNTDCCPSGWVLYRGKCLFISVLKKTWWESRDDCRQKSAQLLVQGNWPSWTLTYMAQNATGREAVDRLPHAQHPPDAQERRGQP